jgi:SAM-dependent methyltransferase
VLDLEKAKARPWFHSIDFRPDVDFTSKTRFSGHVPPNYTLFGFYDLITHLDLHGASCIDIGTMDGIAAFIMKKLGAGSVVATDIGERDTFHFARQTLGLDVEFLRDTDLYNITQRVDHRRFDVTLMAGVLYHVFDPLYAITAARHLTRENGYAIIETHYLPGESRPIMQFNPTDPEPIEQANFFWRASMSCLEGMFRLCCFHVVARRDIGKRVTYLLRAARPSEMTEANEMTRRIIQSFMGYRHYRENIDFSALEKSGDVSGVRLVSPPAATEKLSVQTYKPRVPYQPKWSPP